MPTNHQCRFFSRATLSFDSLAFMSSLSSSTPLSAQRLSLLPRFFIWWPQVCTPSHEPHICISSYVTLMEVTLLRLVLMLSRDVHCSLQLYQSFSLGHIILSWVQEHSTIHPEGGILSEEQGDTIATLSCTHSQASLLSHTHYQKSLQPPPHSLPNSSQPGLFSKCLLITHGKLWVLCIQPDLLSLKNYLYVARFYFHFETENTTSASWCDFSSPTLMQILNSILIGHIKIWSWAEWLHEG